MSEFLRELNEGSGWINVPYPPSVSVREAQNMNRRIRGELAYASSRRSALRDL